MPACHSVRCCRDMRMLVPAAYDALRFCDHRQHHWQRRSVLLVNSSDNTVSGSTFSSNTVVQFGGAMSVGDGTLIVQDSTCATPADDALVCHASSDHPTL
jgi:hypothetical protein